MFAACPAGSPLPVANGSDSGYARIDFELDGPHDFDLSGSLSGSGDFEVRVRIHSLPVPPTDEPFDYLDEESPGGGPACPGGSTLGDSGSLAAGSWRFEVFATAEGWSQVPTSAASLDTTLTLTPQ